MERTVVRQFLYPAFLEPPPTLQLSDQFAFRPTASPVAAIISLIHTITHLLQSNPYVIVISLDFSKAFDTVRHYSLLQKLAQLDLPDHVYNWMVDYFEGHSHCTQYCGQTSEFRSITASIILGSNLGPASYVINAADLRAVTAGNSLIKFADDTYLVIPASNSTSRQAEMKNVTEWAQANNQKLNCSKSTEIVFVDPPLLEGISRVISVKILDVIFSNTLSMSEHVRAVITSCAQTLYALRTLRAHGMSDTPLQAIFRAVVIAKLLYASSAW